MRNTIARIGATGAGAVLALGLFAAAPPAGASSSGNHGVNSADSTCFTATGQTQGRSHSDPDGMSNGGADKPGCTGGIDADRDGNNGCGNDTDREDDNNGWCGRKPKGDNRNGNGNANDATPPPPAPAPTTTSTSTSTSTGPATAVSPALTLGLSDCQVDAKEATDCPATAQASTPGAELSVAAGPGTAADSGTGAEVSATTAGTSGDVLGAATPPTTAPGTQVLGETVERPSSLPRTGAAVGGLALVGLGLVGSGRLTLLARRLLRIG